MPREHIHFEVEGELKERYDQLPWGMRTVAMRVLMEKLCDFYDRHGELAIGVVMAGEFNFKSDKIVD